MPISLGASATQFNGRSRILQNLPFLALETFVDLKTLSNRTKFTDENIFSYLGKGLNQWLMDILAELGVKDVPLIHGTVLPGAYVSGAVYIGAGAVVEPTAFILGPCYIGPDSEVRHGAYIRGNVYAGKKSVIGHTTEVKGSVLLDGAKAAHFAYLGDSFLGQEVNLGAGTKLANLKLGGAEVRFTSPDGTRHKSGLRKFGAIIGDHCETGCNSVLSPGTLLLPRTAVMPAIHFNGTLKEGIAR